MHMKGANTCLAHSQGERNFFSEVSSPWAGTFFRKLLAPAWRCGDPGSQASLGTSRAHRAWFPAGRAGQMPTLCLHSRLGLWAAASPEAAVLSICRRGHGCRIGSRPPAQRLRGVAQTLTVPSSEEIPLYPGGVCAGVPQRRRKAVPYRLPETVSLEKQSRQNLHPLEGECQ